MFFSVGFKNRLSVNLVIRKDDTLEYVITSLGKP